MDWMLYNETKYRVRDAAGRRVSEGRTKREAVAIADAAYVLRWLLQMRDGGMMLPTNIVELARRAVSVFPG